MTDSHTHLYLEEYYPDGGIEAARQAIEAGVSNLVLPNIDRESVEPLLKLHDAYPLNTFVAAGLHPTEAHADWKDELRDILDRFSDVKLIAIGEIGIDLHWDKSNFKEQMDAFGYQLDLALQMGIPAIVHSRDAADETLEMLSNFQSNAPQIILHSYSYGVREAERALELIPEVKFGFNGVITFKNAHATRESASFVGIERILTETDSPFLTPVPHRGETNQSSYIPLIVDAVASAISLSIDEATSIIDRTSEAIFKFHA